MIHSSKTLCKLLDIAFYRHSGNILKIQEQLNNDFMIIKFLSLAGGWGEGGKRGRKRKRKVKP